MKVIKAVVMFLAVHTPATNCLYVQNSVKQNGQLSTTDGAFHFDSPVYVINKP